MREVREGGRGGTRTRENDFLFSFSFRSMMLLLLSHLPVFLTEVCCHGNNCGVAMGTS